MYDEKQLANALGDLSDRHRIAFAASCCERLVPHYRILASTDNVTDPNLLDEALNEIWKLVEDSRRPTDTLKAMKETIDGFIRSHYEPGFLFASTAFNAAAAVSYTAECCFDGDVKWPVFAARMAIETVDTYLYLVNAPFGEGAYWGGDVAEIRRQGQVFDEWIEQSPLMIDEFRKQAEDLEKLEANEEPQPILLAEMRRSSQQRGIQPQVRGLIRPN